MTDKAISNKDHLSRYCKSATIEGQMPGVNAFLLREGEDYLSVNWLEYFKTDLSAAIDRVRDALGSKQYTISKNGRFAVLNVGSAMEMVLKIARYMPSIKRIQDRDDPSHAGVYIHKEYAYLTALALTRYVRSNPDTVYQGTHE